MSESRSSTVSQGSSCLSSGPSSEPNNGLKSAVDVIEFMAVGRVLGLLYLYALCTPGLILLGALLQWIGRRALDAQRSAVLSALEDVFFWCSFLGPVLLSWWAAIFGVEVSRKIAGFAPACRKCGYDLRGLEGKSLVCPECGTVRSGHALAELAVEGVSRRVEGACRALLILSLIHLLTWMLLLRSPVIPNAVSSSFARWVTVNTGSAHNLTTFVVGLSLTACMLVYAVVLHVNARIFERKAKAALNAV